MKKSIENFDLALSHPNEKDIENLKQKIRKCLGKDLKK